jgi:hypothetical protein
MTSGIAALQEDPFKHFVEEVGSTSVFHHAMQRKNNDVTTRYRSYQFTYRFIASYVKITERPVKDGASCPRYSSLYTGAVPKPVPATM